jgi:hypothetical protein
VAGVDGIVYEDSEDEDGSFYSDDELDDDEDEGDYEDDDEETYSDYDDEDGDGYSDEEGEEDEEAEEDEERDSGLSSWDASPDPTQGMFTKVALKPITSTSSLTSHFQIQQQQKHSFSTASLTSLKRSAMMGGYAGVGIEGEGSGSVSPSRSLLSVALLKKSVKSHASGLYKKAYESAASQNVVTASDGVSLEVEASNGSVDSRNRLDAVEMWGSVSGDVEAMEYNLGSLNRRSGGGVGGGVEEGFGGEESLLSTSLKAQLVTDRTMPFNLVHGYGVGSIPKVRMGVLTTAEGDPESWGANNGGVW